MMDIKRQLIKTNYTKKSNKVNQYIVIHYTTDRNGNALNSLNWFNNPQAQCSAHYIVDDNNILQAVDDCNAAWHCGSSSGYKHPQCRNVNSIGIEMASNHPDKVTKNIPATDRGWYFTEKTLTNTVELTKMLMKKYNIPVDNVIRHYDVTGKICPAPMVWDEAQWINFKNRLVDKEDTDVNIDTLIKNMSADQALNIIRLAQTKLQDNDTNETYDKARAFCVENGIINGGGGNPINYMWEDFVTREQLAQVVYNIINKKVINK